MKKTLKFYFKKHWTYWLAFSLPFFILFFVYLANGIYWGSETSPLLGDGFHQYVIFDIALRNILHNNSSIFYTFTSGLGLNFYALSSYYLGSFLSPLVYFFNLSSMPDAIYLFTLCKFGLTGLTSYYSLRKLYTNIPNLLLLSLSTSYSLMSFSTSQIEIATWQDVFILIPLILLGFDQLIQKRKKTLYHISLSILFIQNYYFGYMVSLFLILWYITYLSWNFRTTLKRFLDFILVSLFSALTSMVMLLPTILDLQTHGEKLTKINQIFNSDAWYLDIFAKNFIGSFDTTKYGSIPMIYIGILPFLLSLIFFTLPTIKLRVKLTYFFILSLLVASFYLQPLDLFWQGMHAPNMFLHRYSWLFSIVILFMATETLNRLKTLTLSRFLFSFLF
ncbi:ABC transporter, permease protein [Streptococcus sp. DD10]|nr:ABC transporter, permease protein [Streptococcus sp. DD10]